MADDRRKRELAASEALGALTPDELDRLEVEAEDDPELAALLERYRETVAGLEKGVARTPASELLRARLLRLVEAEGGPEPEPPEGSSTGRGRIPRLHELRARRFPRPRRLLSAGLAASVAAVAAIAIVLIAVQDAGLGDPDARAAISGSPEFAAVHGEAALFDPQRDDGVLVLELAAVPPLPSAHHYTVWVLRSTTAGAMEAVGTFSPADDGVRLELRLPGPGDYEAVDISVQADGGPPEHSGVSVAAGTFSS